jgi:hypothetical protein
MTQVGQHSVTASVALQTVAWGTKLHLSCTYHGHDWPGETPPSYALVLHTKQGDSQQLATWRVLPNRPTELDAATNVDQAEIASLDIVVVGGDRPVLTLSPTSS